jgi:hypothetical protein
MMKCGGVATELLSRLKMDVLVGKKMHDYN